MTNRNLVAAIAAVASIVGTLALPLFDRVDLLSLDVLHWLRHQAESARSSPPPSRVTIIALDEETYRTPPFAGTPAVVWTPALAKVLDSVIAAGAAVVGFDVIYPTSIERYAGGYDRAFLQALREGSRDGKVVLGKIQHSSKPIAPFPAQVFAVGGAKNVRSLNLIEDADGIVRRVPIEFLAERATGLAESEPSMAMELARRSRAGANISVDHKRPIAVNFATHPSAVPTYALADIFACVEAGRAEFLAAQFRDRIVVIGSVLDAEDRKLTARRFVGFADPGANTARCALPVENRVAPLADRDSMPGVFVLANAIDNLLRGDSLHEFARLPYAALTVPLVAAAAALTLLVAPFWAALGLIGLGIVWMGLATAAFTSGLVLPLLDPLLGSAAAFGLMTAFRFTVADRDKRFLRRTFGLYLAPSIVDAMAARGTMPTLGGEERILSVLFSDVAKFSTISEGLTPTALVSFMNEYLSLMTDIIEKNGGFVDKYIGDAVVAVFGAPHDDPDHAQSAVRAAIECASELERRQGSFSLPPGAVVRTRIGINSGPMLVGNIGSRRRFNYTVMGDAVNLAARLEGANKLYGTNVLVSDATAGRCPGVAFREIDRVQVVGRDAAVALFAPLAAHAAVTPRHAADYAVALAAYRARRFMEAAAQFEALAAQGDGPSRVLAARARGFVQSPPPPAWDGTTALDAK